MTYRELHSALNDFLEQLEESGLEQAIRDEKIDEPAFKDHLDLNFSDLKSIDIICKFNNDEDFTFSFLYEKRIEEIK